MSNREDRPSSNEELKGDTYSTPRIQAFLAMRNLTKPVGKSAGQQSTISDLGGVFYSKN